MLNLNAITGKIVKKADEKGKVVFRYEIGDEEFTICKAAESIAKLKKDNPKLTEEQGMELIRKKLKRKLGEHGYYYYIDTYFTELTGDKAKIW